MRQITDLPIERALPEIIRTLTDNATLLITAEPGAGKSTVVPLALLEQSFLNGQKILMLEPRRLAARASARRMAFLLGEKVGQTVGYRTRFETVVGKSTRIEVITEAILTRMIQQDPELNGVGLLIFDEFHERAIHTDLGLALALDARSAFREDLKMVLMSATLDAGKISAFLGNCPVIRTPGRAYEVKVIYSDTHADYPLDQRMAFALESALQAFPGDLLAFLPGEGEIRRTAAAFRNVHEKKSADDHVLILPLFGNLTGEEQDRALAPAPAGVRKVILATSIAETSLTIDGVRIVVDSCRMRVPRFSPKNAMNQLETLPVSQASAEQRKGRAGRISEGVCIRLCGALEFQNFPPFHEPEILSCDLAPLALELVKWGITPETLKTLRFLDPPPDGRIRQAFSLLRELDAVNADSALTPHGEKLLRFPLHPRLAHMVVRGAELGAPLSAARFAAMMSERDFLKSASADLSVRMACFQRGTPANDPTFDRAVWERVRRIAAQILELLPEHRDTRSGDPLPLLTALAYPDRIARWRTPHSGDYVLANGALAVLRKSDSLIHQEFLAAAQLEGDSSRASIFSAVPIPPDLLRGELAFLIRSGSSIFWDAERKMVCGEQIRAIGSVVLERKQLPRKLTHEELLPALLNGIRKTGFSAFPWKPEIRQLWEKLVFLHRFMPEDFPDVSEEHLMSTLEDWLAPFVSGIARLSELEKLPWSTILESMPEPRVRMKLETFAPTRIELPSGSRIRVDYSNPEQPQLSARLQELFGMMDTPKLANGRVPLLMDILSPSMRTVQKSSDLRSFWNDSYFLVRKDMRGRYPKHNWPENPLEAVASRRGIKPKK